MNLSDFEGLLTGHLKKLAGVQAVGTPWFGWDPLSKPAGVQLYSGQEVRRDAYSKHWELVSSGKRKLVTEAEWQAYVAEHGWCPWFSEGDGSTTYRFPLIKGVHPKIVSAMAEAGQHIRAGVPNITGQLRSPGGGGTQFLTDGTNVGVSGALWCKNFASVQSASNSGDYYSSPTSIDFDASRVNSIYGNSDTVQPEALTMVVGEWVVGVARPIGVSTAETMQASISELESKTAELEHGTGFSDAGRQAIVGWGMPDYSAGVSIASGYVAAVTGVAFVCPNGATDGAIYVNGIQIGRSQANNQDVSTVTVPLFSGDTITWSGNLTAVVFPCRMV